MQVAIDNPIAALCSSASDYFARNGKLISLSRKLEKFDGVQAFVDEVMDALALREIDFKQSRYYDK